jgi:hypothetical protein
MKSLARPGNDAFATIAGFVFQVNVTIQHWLKLGAGEYLELEAGEDIDLVRQEPEDPGAYRSAARRRKSTQAPNIHQAER